jgi:hypothetical protein
MFIYVDVEMNNGYSEVKRVEINDENLVKMIDRYFEVKGIKIQETGII